MSIISTIIAAIWINGLQLSHNKCIEALIRTLITKLSINLVDLARGAFPGTKTLSTVRRIERLLALNIFRVGAVGRAIVSELPPQNQYILTMDRTTWELGKRTYNILAIGICFSCISIPIYFTVYDKRGATNWIEQMVFMEHVLDIIPANKIRCLVADREFGYSKFIKWLGINNIPYCLRLKEDTYVHDTATGKNCKMKTILRSLAHNERVILSHSYIVSGNTPLRIYALRRDESDNGTLIILATPRESTFTDKIYRLRWQIETTFHAMKSAGFNMEDTHLSINGRFQNMLAISLIAYACVFIVGLGQARQHPIPTMKSNGRRRYSIFSFGMQFVVNEICRTDPTDRGQPSKPPSSKNCHVL